MNNILNSKQQTIFKMIKISWIMWKKALYQTIPFSLICLTVNTFYLDPGNKPVLMAYRMHYPDNQHPENNISIEIESIDGQFVAGSMSMEKF